MADGLKQKPLFNKGIPENFYWTVRAAGYKSHVIFFPWFTEYYVNGQCGRANITCETKGLRFDVNAKWLGSDVLRGMGGTPVPPTEWWDVSRRVCYHCFQAKITNAAEYHPPGFPMITTPEQALIAADWWDEQDGPWGKILRSAGERGIAFQELLP